MIAIVGLGNMGLALGRRIVEHGHRAVGVDVAGERRTRWTELTGMPSTDRVDELPGDVRRVLVVVRLTEQAAGVLRALPARSDLTCYVATTLDVEAARRLQAYAPPGPRIIELPVSGGESGATDGTLTVLAAGDVTDDDHAFLTDTIAARVVTFDRPGDPTLAKLFNNVTGAYNALALGRMLELAHAAGLDPRRLLDVLLTSSGGSWIAGAFAGLRDDLLVKDVELLRGTLAELPTVHPDQDLAADLDRARTLLTGDGD